MIIFQQFLKSPFPRSLLDNDHANCVWDAWKCRVLQFEKLDYVNQCKSEGDDDFTQLLQSFDITDIEPPVPDGPRAVPAVPS